MQKVIPYLEVEMILKLTFHRQAEFIISVGRHVGSSVGSHPCPCLLLPIHFAKMGVLELPFVRQSVSPPVNQSFT